MHHIAGYDRSQTLLLPESLDELSALRTPVRFIDGHAGIRQFVYRIGCAYELVVVLPQ
jgi:hypothetical protein